MLAPFFTYPSTIHKPDCGTHVVPQHLCSTFPGGQISSRAQQGLGHHTHSEDQCMFGSPRCRLNQLRNHNIFDPFINKSEILSQLSQKTVINEEVSPLVATAFCRCGNGVLLRGQIFQIYLREKHKSMPSNLTFWKISGFLS